MPDRALVMTPAEELPALDLLSPKKIKDTRRACQPANGCSGKRVMYEAVRREKIHVIAPGMIATPLAVMNSAAPAENSTGTYSERVQRAARGRQTRQQPLRSS